MVLDIYNSTLNFAPEFEYYCFKNCYRQVLEQYGVKNACYYINCTVDWVFQEDGQDEFGYRFTSGDPDSSLLPPFDKKIHVFFKDSLSEDEIWSKNKQKIHDGMPVVVAADIFYLDYLPYYQKKHGRHSLILCGLSEDEKHVHLVDWYTPWFYKGSMSKDNLRLARSSTNPADALLGSIPIRWMWAEVENSGWNKTDRELILKTINLSLARFHSKKEEDGTLRGLNALNSLLALIERNLIIDVTLRKKFIEDLYNKLYYTFTRRNLLKFYVERACKESGYKELEFVSVLLSDNVKRWQQINFLITKFTLVGSEANYIKIVEAFRNVINKENEFHKALSDAGEKISSNHQ